MTYDDFCTKWGNGCGSSMCAGAKHVVLARGSVPCDVVFVGEAPGISEDALGLPFVGPAGKLMDDILLQSFMWGDNSDTVFREDGSPSYAFCNLVGCIPVADGRKASEPDDDQVRKCAPRLIEFLQLCQPRLIVTVGQLSDAWLDPLQRHGIKLPDLLRKVRMVSIPHPAGILRAPIAQQGMMIRRSIVVLSNAVAQLGMENGHGTAPEYHRPR